MGAAQDTDHLTAELTLDRLSQALESALSGLGQRCVARALCELLDVDTVLLAELPISVHASTARVLDGWSHGRPVDSFTYEIAGSPCDLTLRQGVCVHERGVAAAYPADLALSEDGIEGYAGRVLCDRDGSARGLLVALSTRPLSNSRSVVQAFAAFAALALAELEHQRWRREHDGRHSLIHELVERLSDAVAVVMVDPPIPMNLPVMQQVRLLTEQARLSAVNEAVALLAGVPSARLLNGRLADLYGPDTPALVQAWLRDGCQADARRIVRAGPDGTEVHWDCMLIPVIDQDHLVRVWAMNRDVTRHERHTQAVRRQALLDPLTGLGNRAALHEHLQHLADAAGCPHAVVVLDVHQFRAINDAMGHATGDGVLQVLASRMAGWRDGAWQHQAFRLAADEFALVMQPTGCTSGPPTACGPCRPSLEALATCLHEPMQIAQTELSVTLTMGLAHSDGTLSDADTLLWRADLAKRQARERGQTLVEYDRSLEPTTRLDLSMRADLRLAVTREEFVLRYQPKVAPDSGRLVGLEALIRWPHPRTGREVSPADFIPYVEATSYIHPVTRWVIHQALTDLASLPDQPDLCMAVNISAKNLLDEGFVATVQQALAHHGVAAHRLELELTESSFLASPKMARQQVEALSALGVRVSIDDFGTGFSSLSYLQDLPVHAIKVDQAFVRPMGHTAKSATIVRIAVELAHALGMQAIAEGVETAELVPELARMGYDAIQGYVVSRPVPLHEALQAARQWQASLQDLSGAHAGSAG